jgi:hypothetical protein
MLWMWLILGTYLYFIITALFADQPGWPTKKAVFWPIPAIRATFRWIRDGFMLAIKDKET